jgi:hypothetical protein
MAKTPYVAVLVPVFTCSYCNAAFLGFRLATDSPIPTIICPCGACITWRWASDSITLLLSLVREDRPPVSLSPPS